MGASDVVEKPHTESPINFTFQISPKEDGKTQNLTKRGRPLTRQPRVKRDSDPTILSPILSTSNQPSPTISDLEPFSEAVFLHQQQHPSQLHFHTLTVPHHRIERHSSEPSPNQFVAIGSSSTPGSPKYSHLLTVPKQSSLVQSTAPFLLKQHSHPLLPSQHSFSESDHLPYNLHRQLSFPISATIKTEPHMTTSANLMLAIPPSPQSPPICCASVNTTTTHTTSVHADNTSHPSHKSRTESPTIVVSEPIFTQSLTTTTNDDNMPTNLSNFTGSVDQNIPTIRVKTTELQRSSSTPQMTREPSMESRSQHCPVMRPGPALGCNFCWNTIDGHGRILRRKTKYHCPECQTNLCIVPCFQEYHERGEGAASGGPSSSKKNNDGGGTSGDTPNNSTGSSSGKNVLGGLRMHPKASGNYI